MAEANDQLPGDGYTASQVEEILDDAAELQVEVEGEERLSNSDLVASAEEAGIDAKYVAAAITRQRVTSEQRSVNRQIGLIGGGAALLLLALLLLSGRATLRRNLAAVELQRSQVENVVQRRQELTARLPTAAGGDAFQRAADEVVGAEYRVSVERKRYLEATARYNQAAGSLSGGLARLVFRYPARADALPAEPGATR